MLILYKNKSIFLINCGACIDLQEEEEDELLNGMGSNILFIKKKR